MYFDFEVAFSPSCPEFGNKSSHNARLAWICKFYIMAIMTMSYNANITQLFFLVKKVK